MNKYQKFQKEYYENPYTRTQNSRPLDELVERATPKKVIISQDLKGYYPCDNYWRKCPVCNKTVYNDNETIDKFCPNCGQKLGWEK